MPGAARGQRQHYCDSGSGSFARANAHGAAECRDSFPHSQKPKASAARSSLAGEPNPVILISALGLSRTNMPRYSRRTIKPCPASSCNSRLMRLRSSSCACTRRRDSSKTSGTASATACIGVRPFIGDRRDTTAPRGQRECGSGTSRPGGQRLTLWLRQPAFYQASTRQCQLKTQKNQNGKMLDARGCPPYQIQSKGCCAISPQGSLMARRWSPFFPACPLD